MNHEWTRIKETLNRGIVESDFYRFNAFNVYNGLTRLCPNQSPSRSGFDASRSGFDESNQIKPNQTGKFFVRTNRMNHRVTEARRTYLTAENTEIAKAGFLSSLCSLRLAPLVTPLSPLPHVELPDRPGSSAIIRLIPRYSGLLAAMPPGRPPYSAINRAIPPYPGLSRDKKFFR